MTLDNAKENRKLLHKTYYSYECQYCHKILLIDIFDKNDGNILERIMFEPKEVETERYEFVFDDNTHEVKSMKTVYDKEIQSSDAMKDTFKCKCNQCGSIQTLTRKELYDNPKYGYFGDNNIRFELNEVETERAKAFMKKHNHDEEFRAQGKLAFSTIGQQFTYEINPSSIGNFITIKCNHCGESEDITDTDNF